MKALAQKIASRWGEEHRQSVQKMVEAAIDEYIAEIRQDGGDDCGTCGANLKGYTFKMTTGLCSTLIKIATYARDHDIQVVNVFGDVHMSNSDKTNFSHLQHFGLIDKAATPRHWYITTKGIDFLCGRAHVPENITIFRNRVTGRSQKQIGIRTLNLLPFEWQQDFTEQPFYDESK